MSANFKHPAMKQLTEQQARYAPIEKRLEQMSRAEKLLTQVIPGQSYKYQDLTEVLTGYRSEKYPDLSIEGDDLLHDLPKFVEELSASSKLPVEQAGEPVFTVNDLSERYNVSTKTIDRWRKRGLVSRKFLFGNRSRVGFLRSSVDRFVIENETEIHRSSQFSQISEAEKQELILKARRLALHGACPAEVGRRLSKIFKRSPDTIRYTLKQYDDANPQNAVFPNSTSPLTEDRKLEIYQRYINGMSAELLAEEFCRTKTSVYRIVTEVRAKMLLETPIAFMDSPEFHEAGAEKVILGPPPEVEKKSRAVKSPPGLPPTWQVCTRLPC